MKKQLLKGFTMITLVVVVSLATAVVSAKAQSSSKLVVADIPFSFVVAGETMPAGEYRVTQGLGNGLIIQSADSTHSAMRLTNTIQPESDHNQAKLVFRRYGERYFLSEVWNGFDESGRQLLRSKEEKAIERELAAIQSKSEFAQRTYAIVEVLAKAR